MYTRTHTRTHTHTHTHTHTYIYSKKQGPRRVARRDEGKEKQRALRAERGRGENGELLFSRRPLLRFLCTRQSGIAPTGIKILFRAVHGYRY